MCGIFGMLASEGRDLPPGGVGRLADVLFRLSESRGKEASGLAILNRNSIKVLKGDLPATRLIKTRDYRDLFYLKARSDDKDLPATAESVSFIGHSRLVTDGGQEIHHNNQPVVQKEIVGIHNGIIVNHCELWPLHPDLNRQCEVDSEIIFSLIGKFTQETGSPVQAARKTYALIKGAASIAVFFSDRDEMLLASNTGSLYYLKCLAERAVVFASEGYILRRLPQERGLQWLNCEAVIHRIQPNTGLLVHLKGARIMPFDFKQESDDQSSAETTESDRRVIDMKLSGVSERKKINTVQGRFLRRFSDIESRYPYDEALFDTIRRCTRCILPETMPYIDFDSKGVCNFCRDYKKNTPMGLDPLLQKLERHRGRTGDIDCLVGLSGGRDSIYALHYICKHLRMNPAAYTYDWGMVTDLARRNISRICGALGVEHILVSADINRKRRYIRKNVKAWLKRPELGTVPLFMAGDKHYFYYAEQVKKQLGVDLMFFGENMLEKADKAGFSWVKPATIDKDHAYTISTANKLRMLAYYGKNFMLNPLFLNESVPDTLTGYASYYIINRTYLNLYRFIQWDEETVVSTIRALYDWEGARDTAATWRVGDGTAPFYNYIYFVVAGFTENDAMRSNQIREGMMSRQEALGKVRDENRPRFESIWWYLDTIKMGQDYEGVLRKIHSIPKRY